VTTEDGLWDIVVDNRNGILATINEDGSPHLSNVYYVVDPARRLIRISTTATRAKGRNLLRDTRAVLHVAGHDFFNFAVVEGDVTLAIPTEPGDPAADEQYEVHAALGAASDRPGFDHQMITDGRLIVRIEVKKLYGLVLDGRRT
jgi:PPOX class probable F420-dependent enzyme